MWMTKKNARTPKSDFCSDESPVSAVDISLVVSVDRLRHVSPVLLANG